MATAYGVFVLTPPPTETILIGYARTREKAHELAMKWGGGHITWEGGEGISAYGEKVVIEEIETPIRKKGKSLSFLTWDEIFETGVFEAFLGPNLGFRLNKIDEVEREDREKWGEIWSAVSKWILDALARRDIEPYSLLGSKIYISDVKDLIDELEMLHKTRGPREWAPGRHEWQLPLANAFKTLLEAYE